MRSAFFSPSWKSRLDGLRARATSILLVIAIEVALLLVFLTLAPPRVFVPMTSAPKGVTLDLLPDREAEAEHSEAKSEEKQQSRQPPADKALKLPKPVVKVPSPQSAPQSDIWSKVIPLTRQELASVDTALTRPSDSAAQSAERGASSAVVGTGSKGQPLYAARWFREPSRALLNLYLPAGPRRTGYGRIACQMIADYRVDNCEEVDEFPPGSGLAGAVRQAAPQFRVIPPRLGGRTIVGAWVMIQIDYSVHEAR